MRKVQKKQAEEFMQLLGQAHNEIKETVREKNFQAALELLSDCQQGAIALGSMIEGTEGEKCPLISLLEDYCELLYQIYNKITQNQADDDNEVHHILQTAFLNIKKELKGIKTQLEVVFLPYKASMWDSLDSVWRAALEEPCCTAYVVPIPYYDKKTDGSFGELHYEGNLYPVDVPVVWYGDYDFEKQRPDIIFIHNPYDEYNHVTSVPPFFYARNLKKYTDKLVYIPYFNLDEINPDNRNEVSAMEHFCLTPGVVYADKVVVQSEAMRQVYINVLTENFGEETSGLWKEKVLGIGSPKVDKVLNTRKENLNVPGEWLKIIEKTDGSWKKIVLYNTGISALLRHGECMLDKMRAVFRVFRKSCSETALLWRPHPLIEATIKAMRPQLWDEYKKLVQEYCEAGWGIYDDSVEMERAVVLCDAYYGDESSLVKLCKEAGRPVLIQDPSIF